MPLVSKISPRTRDVTEADFKSVPRITDYTSSHDGISGLIKVWNESVRYMPQDFADLFDGLLEANDEIQIGSLKPNTIEFNIHASGDQMDTFIREYELSSPTLTHTLTNIPGRRQGTGIGRKWAVAGIDMNVMMGVTRAQFDASMDMGVYAWGKSRYLLDYSNDVYEDINQRQSKLTMAKLSAVEQLTPKGHFTMGMAYAESFKTPDLYKLIDLDFDLLEPIKQARLSGQPYDIEYFTQALKHYLKPYPEVKENENTGFFEEQAEAMIMLIRSCDAKNLPLSIGKFSLAAGRARMMSDYQDDAHITEVMERMGGFRNSKVVPVEQHHRLG